MKIEYRREGERIYLQPGQKKEGEGGNENDDATPSSSSSSSSSAATAPHFKMSAQLEMCT